MFWGIPVPMDPIQPDFVELYDLRYDVVEIKLFVKCLSVRRFHILMKLPPVLGAVFLLTGAG